MTQRYKGNLGIHFKDYVVNGRKILLEVEAGISEFGQALQFSLCLKYSPLEIAGATFTLEQEDKPRVIGANFNSAEGLELGAFRRRLAEMRNDVYHVLNDKIIMHEVKIRLDEDCANRGTE